MPLRASNSRFRPRAPRSRPVRYMRKKRYVRRVSKPTRAVARSVGFPDRMFAKLKYSDLHSHSYSGAGSVSFLQYRVNSIFDPYYTGVGHQPKCHDQYAVLYNRYRVYGMAYTISFTNTSTTEQCEVVIQARPNSTITGIMTEIIEDSAMKQRAVLGIEGSGRNIRTMKGYCSVAKIRGITKTRLKAESDYQAIFGNDPPIECFLNLGIIAQNTAASLSVYVRVDLTYYVEMYDRKMIATS